MAGINRVGSPMDLIDESFEQSKEKLEQKKKSLIIEQRAKSPFLIGSIEEVNKKISKLDRKLQRYTQLVVESRASDNQEEQLLRSDRPRSSVGRAIIERKEREQKELNRFAGYYTLKQTFLPGRSERVKNISKISLSPSKTQAKKDTGKPKFVELHQYPGYDPTELSDLPDEIPAREMLKKAASATMDLGRKPQYRPDFEQWFYSPMSQAVFQDIFWYLFLEKFQASKNAQIKLFNRTAFNYVKLMWYVKNPAYRDVFFKDYPSLISQAVYAAYCHCFPDSYRQFGEDFKEDLASLVYGWIAGIKPAPRIWLKWNMEKLEPPNIKMREEIMNATKKKSSTSVNFDFLDSLISSNISRYASSASLSQTASNLSAHSRRTRGRRKGKMSKDSSDKRSGSSKVPSSSASSSSHDGKLAEIAEVKPITSSPHKRGKQPKPVDPRKLVEALTPIRETTFEEYDDSQRDKMESQSEQVIKMMAAAHKEPKPKEESHPACKGADTTKSLYNLYGQSPLVAHFLRVKNLTRDAGQVFLVQRTEEQNLPPLGAPTYKDVIRESFKKVRDQEKQYQEMYDRAQKDSLTFSRRQRHMLQDHLRKQTSLLNQPNEVKRLSDLLMLEFRYDKKDADCKDSVVLVNRTLERVKNM
ncbi:LOW QUALITY PROTEIN: protein FAM227A-like [Ruditapes philippinarum]|uniref:LOW QUALITY PROTEIN: protein FAM227A-like n=1 Tax=Ruditapes philippinarum TaxID=129788 RepID=UPI00295BBB71|nr:LOW QUALITY PROTEIN: protein FAM227A-like [Ruditapes philippinarum]